MHSVFILWIYELIKRQCYSCFLIIQTLLQQLIFFRLGILHDLVIFSLLYQFSLCKLLPSFDACTLHARSMHYIVLTNFLIWTLYFCSGYMAPLLSCKVCGIDFCCFIAWQYHFISSSLFWLFYYIFPICNVFIDKVWYFDLKFAFSLVFNILYASKL